MDPNTSPARAALLARNSITTLLPDLGPLTSPLSSSLSAIVADSLRRGVDHNNHRLIRPIRRNTTSRGQHQTNAEPSATSHKRHSLASGTLSPGGGSELPEQQGQGSGQKTREALRQRSLSATLGDLFTRNNNGGNASGNGKQRDERRDG